MHITRPMLLVLASLLLGACAGTTKQASWVDPGKTGQKVSSVFIIGAAKSDINRRVFEDELARRLQARGVRGIPSYPHLDSKALDDRAATMAKLKSLGAEAVIIAKVVGQRTETTVNPGRTYVSPGLPAYPTHYRDHWHDYYRSSYQVIRHPATVTDYQVFTVETSLYGADEGMIWTMQSETTGGGQLQAQIREFVELVVEDLAANGLI